MSEFKTFDVDTEYESPIDIFLFAKYDVISSNVCRQLMELFNSTETHCDNLIIRRAINSLYHHNINTRNFVFNFKESASLYAKIKITLENSTLNEYEILRMNKTPEEVCVWIAYFIFKSRYDLARKIRTQALFPKYYNRILLR